MWRLNCGCNPPIENNENIVQNKPVVNKFGDIKLPNTTNKIYKLKCETIYDFLDIVKELECGIQPNLQEILEEISLIEIAMGGNFNISRKIYTSCKDDKDTLLRKNKYLSEFATEEERLRVIRNLGLDSTRHIVLSKDEYENLDYFDKNAIYFITG